MCMFFSACTTSSINMMNFHINICDQKKTPLKSLIDILNIDTVCSKCLHWHTMMPSEDLYMILEDHTPGFKRASFIWRIKKCQNILGAGFHGDKIIKNPMQMYMYAYSTQKGGVGGYTLKVFEIGERRLAGTNVQVCSKATGNLFVNQAVEEQRSTVRKITRWIMQVCEFLISLCNSCNLGMFFKRLENNGQWPY